jgi:hypothetical protein
MIRGLVEAMLGQAGTSVLRYYEGHVLVLGTLIVLYGVLMWLSWNNLVGIYRRLVLAAAETLRQEGASQAGNSNAAARPAGGRRADRKTGGRKTADLPWQEAVDKARFPLVSRQAALLPVRKSVAAAKSIIDERELWQHAQLVANGANIRRIVPDYRLMPRKQGARQGGANGED